MLGNKGWHTKGLALAEVLIAMAIFIVVAVGVSSYVTQSRNFSVKIEGAASCRSEISSLIQDFAQNSSIVVTNYIQGGVGAVRTPAIGALRTEAAYGNAAPYRNYQNIENAVTRALQLYTTTTTYCTDNSGDGKRVSTAQGNTGVFNNAALVPLLDRTEREVYLSIAPYELSTSTADCTVTANTLANTVGPSSNTFSSTRGIKVKVTIRPGGTITAENQQNSCVAEIIAKYSPDNSNPTITPIAAATVDCANRVVTVFPRSSEPGSLFECSDDGGATWANCQSFAGFGGNTNVTSANPGMGNTTTDATVMLSGFPIPTAGTFSVRAVDTAGNTSANIDTAVNCADADCQGFWSACSACPGTQTFTVTQAQQGAGLACPVSPRACGAGPDNCVGSWSGCPPGPNETYTITNPASCGGAACPNASGDTRACPRVCPPDCDCIGSWSACSGCPGTQTFTVTQVQTGLGTACSDTNGATQVCGTAPVDCAYSWGACDVHTGLKDPIITTPPSCGGLACPGPTACPVDCVGAWGPCGEPVLPYKTYHWIIWRRNGGAPCPRSNGAVMDDGTCGGGGSYSCVCTDGSVNGEGCQQYSSVVLGAGGNCCVEGDAGCPVGTGQTGYTECSLSTYPLSSTYNDSACNDTLGPLWTGAQCISSSFGGQLKAGFGPCYCCL